ncbi:hypothetical protein FQN53_001615 [Emmonsiellopsis sp. PD_33]|nr:hypothetical protein FQN53_001615 [Emmonsiellopsis sp. PD_33]
MVQLLSTLVTVLAAASAVEAVPTFDFGRWGKGGKGGKHGLHTAARAKGRYLGTATDNIYLGDKPYVHQLKNRADFGQITPSNTLKWETIEPQQGVFNFTPGDELVNMALRNHQFVRCHTLVWHSQLAPWVENGNITWTNETLIDAMVSHVTKTAKHFKGRCHAWDVVNEALNDDGTYRESIFYKIIGEAYIPIAFAAAAKADPHAKLYYNDYDLENVSNKTDGAIRIAKLVQSYGAKIDGIGMQAHQVLGRVPTFEQQKEIMAEYAKLGLESAYTELDVRMTLPSTKEMWEEQAQEYYNAARACVESKGCVGITIWDWTDKYSWIPEYFEGEGEALPWDECLEKKPAYYGLLKGFQGRH